MSRSAKKQKELNNPLTARALNISAKEDLFSLLSHLSIDIDRTSERLLAELAPFAIAVYPQEDPAAPRLSRYSIAGFKKFIPFPLINKKLNAVLLSATPAAIQKLIDYLRASDDANDAAFAESVAAAMANYFVKPAPMKIGVRDFIFGNRCYIMGVLNVTPDSFSDGGRFLNPRKALNRALELAQNGADIIDIGGESSRPSAKPIPANEELKRIIPVIAAIRKRSDIPISVDTTKADVAEAALSEGADMINDISGLRFDEKLAIVAAEAKVPLCIMHSRHTPLTMQKKVAYKEPVTEIIGELRQSVKRAERGGVPSSRIIVDPGIGFSKSAEHNLAILRRLDEFRVFGMPILVGPSRKSFIGAVTGARVEERLPGTIAAVAFAVARGADFVRVHDVKEVAQAVKLSIGIRGEI
ncbi:MAG: hypothetical protein Kow0090_10450 [Myxococcota bacterium]